MFSWESIDQRGNIINIGQQQIIFLRKGDGKYVSFEYFKRRKT